MLQHGCRYALQLCSACFLTCDEGHVCIDELRSEISKFTKRIFVLCLPVMLHVEVSSRSGVYSVWFQHLHDDCTRFISYQRLGCLDALQVDSFSSRVRSALQGNSSNSSGSASSEGLGSSRGMRGPGGPGMVGWPFGQAVNALAQHIAQLPTFSSSKDVQQVCFPFTLSIHSLASISVLMCMGPKTRAVCHGALNLRADYVLCYCL